MAKFRVAVATIFHQERNQGTHHVDIGAIDNRAAIAGAADQACCRYCLFHRAL